MDPLLLKISAIASISLLPKISAFANTFTPPYYIPATHTQAGNYKAESIFKQIQKVNCAPFWLDRFPIWLCSSKWVGEPDYILTGPSKSLRQRNTPCLLWCSSKGSKFQTKGYHLILAITRLFLLIEEILYGLSLKPSHVLRCRKLESLKSWKLL